MVVVVVVVVWAGLHEGQTRPPPNQRETRVLGPELRRRVFFFSHAALPAQSQAPTGSSTWACQHSFFGVYWGQLALYAWACFLFLRFIG